MIKLKRAYDEVEDSDGYRILVDRLWPRGVSKEKLQIEEWLKEIAPSNELRKWIHNNPNKFDDFILKYHKELDQKTQLISKLKELYQEHQTLTLIYASKNREQNNATVLKDYLEREL